MKDELPPIGVIICPEHGRQELTQEEYNQQMRRPDAKWRCFCGTEAKWDDEAYDRYVDALQVLDVAGVHGERGAMSKTVEELLNTPGRNDKYDLRIDAEGKVVIWHEYTGDHASGDTLLEAATMMRELLDATAARWEIKK